MQRANFGEGALSRALMAPRLANTETAICDSATPTSLANIEETLKRIEKCSERWANAASDPEAYVRLQRMAALYKAEAERAQTSNGRPARSGSTTRPLRSGDRER